MSKLIQKTLLLALAASIAFGAADAFGGDIRTKSTSYGLKAGMISPGIWYVGDFEYEPDASYTFGGFIDHQLGPKISGGVSLDIHGFSAYEESNNLIDLGITIKAMLFSEGSQFTFRPGIGIAYGTLGKMGIYESSTYMLLKGGLEVIISTSGNISWLGEIGLFGAPTGGNDDADMYLDTGLLARAGIVF